MSSLASGTLVVTGSAGGMTSLAIKSIHDANPSQRMVLLVRNPSTNPSHLPPASSTVEYLACDLSSLESVKSTAAALVKRVSSGELPPISALVASAAIQQVAQPTPNLTKDGYEVTAATNHLAHFVLINELLPVMQKAGEGKEKGKIVVVGSDAHKNDYKYFKLPAKLENLEKALKVEAGSDEKGKNYDQGMYRYGTSKLLQTITAHELARRISASPEYANKLRVVLWEPGSMGGTGLFRDQPFPQRQILSFFLQQPWLLNWLEPGINASRPRDSAATLTRILLDDPDFAEGKGGEGEEKGGAPYWGPAGQSKQTQGQANDVQLAKTLWEDSKKVTGIETI